MMGIFKEQGANGRDAAGAREWGGLVKSQRARKGHEERGVWRGRKKRTPRGFLGQAQRGDLYNEAWGNSGQVGAGGHVRL